MLKRVAVITVMALFFAAGATSVDTNAPTTPSPSTSLAVETAQVAPRLEADLPAVVPANKTSDSVPDGYVYWKTVTARVTAYEPSKRCCGRFADGKTSTGKNAWKMNGCAAYPGAVPYGTLVHIPGVGLRKVDDTGPAMRRSWAKGRYHIDVRMKYFYQARRWGSRNLDIKLYRKQA